MFTITGDDLHWPQKCDCAAQKQMCRTNEMLYLPAISLYCSRGVWIHESQVSRCYHSETALRTTDTSLPLLHSSSDKQPRYLWACCICPRCIFTCLPHSCVEFTVGNEYQLFVWLVYSTAVEVTLQMTKIILLPFSYLYTVF